MSVSRSAKQSVTGNVSSTSVKLTVTLTLALSLSAGEKEFVTPPLSLSKDEGVFAQAVNRPVVCPSVGLGRSSERDEPRTIGFFTHS